MKKSLLFAEFKDILMNRKVLIPVIAVLFIPILYSGMFLWAFWDPYEGLSDLPVAIVNNDEGAELDGESFDVGEELVKELKDTQDFHYIFVDDEEGEKGLERQEYYMLVEIPNDFSEHATTLLDADPSKLELVFVPNEGYNFLAGQIGESGVKEIKSSLTAKVAETYAEMMFDSIEELGDGFAEAGDKARELEDGASKISDGAKDLSDGVSTLQDGASELNKGASDLNSGAKELSSGLHQLSNAYGQIESGASDLQDGGTELRDGLAQLNEGSKGLQEGLGTISSNTAELKNGTAQLTNGASQVAEGLKELQAALSPLLASLPEEQRELYAASVNSLVAGSEQVATGAVQTDQAVGLLEAGQKEALSGANQLVGGSNQLLAGANQLTAGQSEFTKGIMTFGENLRSADAGGQDLAVGTNELASGTSELSSGAVELKDGSVELADGTIELSNGSSEFKEGLLDAAYDAKITVDEDNYSMVGEPILLDDEGVNEVPNYGTGFTPYFLSLGLFVGALLISIVYPLKEPAIRPASAFSWFGSKFFILLVVGVLQSFIAVGILLTSGLGLEVQSLGYFILSTLLTSLAYLAIIQLLVTTLGDPGRFVAIIILILQLTTSAGTFPLELIPQALQVFNPLLPMTYSVAAFKAVISTGNFAFMWSNLAVLIGFIIIPMILTLAYFMMKHRKMYYKQVEAA
ncbi:hypothetical protein Q73_03605 [Bacillus coahuilensis m2-6]|uniref:YhgE/Pip domain-containing protein n=2 Tax=Bacillus coahuilensis TaxID=408580 RepID=UPI0007501A94|nr:YhgE/Pip domain-containing protein [Bacillus coahuilensis]KUP09169.1 hypothetical protein Q73_03605 [Bacillus coahuilensis m2-6]